MSKASDIDRWVKAGKSQDDIIKELEAQITELKAENKALQEQLSDAWAQADAAEDLYRSIT